MVDFFSWSSDTEPAIVTDATTASAWESLEARYTDSTGNAVLHRVFEIARQHGTVCVLTETRYVDADWRSEHSRFYSTTFSRYPTVAHRLHFFRDVIHDLGDLSALAPSYVGYSIMRPVPSQPVGRTMITPPPSLDTAIRCEGTEELDVIGWPMSVRAMPFMSQDAQYLRCAHADLWMNLRHAFLRKQVSRKLPAHIHDSTFGGMIVGRQVPSDGLSVQQMLTGLTTLGLSPALLPLPRTAEESLATYRRDRAGLPSHLRVL